MNKKLFLDKYNKNSLGAIELQTIRKNSEKFLFNNDHEKDGQIMVLKYLPADAHVLELGGRTGVLESSDKFDFI